MDKTATGNFVGQHFAAAQEGDAWQQREKRLDVSEHDVRRLGRLVGDISNASRLDSELVKEDEETFNLMKTLSNLGQYLGQQAAEKGVDFIIDLPAESISIRGLEARLAQVFVNLITNAISFCEEGDAVRVWARRSSWVKGIEPTYIGRPTYVGQPM